MDNLLDYVLFPMQLINDEKMYNNLNNAAENLDKLMIDLKANPKRYVNFSVFGRKK